MSARVVFSHLTPDPQTGQRPDNSRYLMAKGYNRERKELLGTRGRRRQFGGGICFPHILPAWEGCSTLPFLSALSALLWRFLLHDLPSPLPSQENSQF